MKTTFRLFIAMMLCVSISSYGQMDQIKIKKSAITKDKKKHSELLFSSDDGNGGIVVVRQFMGGLARTPKGYYIEYYDNNLKLVKDAEMEIDNSSIKNIFIKDGNINIIEYKKNKKNKTNDYNILTASLNTLDFTREKLFSIDRKDVKKPFFFAIGFIPISNLGSIDHDPTGEVQLSANSEYIAFNFDLKEDKKETHRIIVYNNNLEKVYDRTFQENIKDKYFEYNSFSVSDVDGSVYYLGKAYKNDSFKDKYKGKINYDYKVYKVNKDGVTDSAFQTEGHFIQSMSLLFDYDSVYTIGAFSDKDSDDYKGICYFKLNPETLAIEKSTFNDFTEQFMIDKYGEKRGKRKKKKKKELPFLTYRDFIIDQNGDIFFNAEEFFVTWVQNVGMNGAPGNSYPVYHYNDIYSCKLNSLGELQWIRTINKAQASSGNSMNYLSFSSTVNNGNMYLFLNGADEVRKLRDDRIMFKQKKVKKLNLYVIEIKPDGTFNYKIIIDDKDSKMTYKVKYGVMSNDGSILFEGNKKKDKQVVKISF